MHRKLGFMVMAVLAALLGLAGYQGIMMHVERERFPPPGQMINVGGYRLHLNCTGTGNPTLVLDSGAGNWSIFWSEVQKTLSRTYTVCTFDRAGYGWSDLSPNPRTSRNMTTELHTLLRSAQLKPPFVLIGHSLGGYNARVYQNQYPDEVAALVLVDSAHPEQWQRLPEEVNTGLQQQIQTLRQVAVLSQLGVLRFFQDQLPQFDLPPDLRSVYIASMMRPQTYHTFASEAESAAISAEQARQVRSLRDLPVLVLTAGNSFAAFQALMPNLPVDRANRVWLKLQTDLTTLSRNSTHRVLEGAGHYLMVDAPDFVSQSIAEFVFRAGMGSKSIR